jgi:hypothetical protein
MSNLFVICRNLFLPINENVESIGNSACLRTQIISMMCNLIQLHCLIVKEVAFLNTLFLRIGYGDGNFLHLAPEVALAMVSSSSVNLYFFSWCKSIKNQLQGRKRTEPHPKNHGGQGRGNPDYQVP